MSNTILPGSLNDQFSFRPGENLPMQTEIDLMNKAGEMGFFAHVKENLEPDLSALQTYERQPLPPIKQAPQAIQVAGIVNIAPQAIDIPDGCKVIGIEVVQTTGFDRVWVSNSVNSSGSNPTQTLADAVKNYSVAIIASGQRKLFNAPFGAKTLYFSANADNTLCALSFYTGEVELKDVL